MGHQIALCQEDKLISLKRKGDKTLSASLSRKQYLQKAHKTGEETMLGQQCSCTTNDIIAGNLLYNANSDRYRRCKTINDAREAHDLTFFFTHRLL